MASNHSNCLCHSHRRIRSGSFLNICVVIAVFVVYTTNTFFGKPNFDAQFLHCYLNDLFAMPFILAYVNLLILWVGKYPTGLTNPIPIACLTIFCVVVWEGLGPMIHASSTRDLFDVVAYSSGSFCYYMVVLVADRQSCDSIGRSE